MPPDPIRRLTYTTAGAAEQALAIGAGPPVLLIVPPLFDEMNRMRRTLVRMMRLLAASGIGCRLIDLPGCNESLADLAAQSIDSWRDAVGEAARQLGATHLLSLRGGAIVDDGTDLPVLRIVPTGGEPLLRILTRTRIAAEREAGRTVTREALLAGDQPVELGGYRLGPALVRELATAVPRPLPDVTVVPPGEGGIAGAALWLRAEPGEDAGLTAALASTTIAWMRQCAAI